MKRLTTSTSCTCYLPIRSTISHQARTLTQARSRAFPGVLVSSAHLSFRFGTNSQDTLLGAQGPVTLSLLQRQIGMIICFVDKERNIPVSVPVSTTRRIILLTIMSVFLIPVFLLTIYETGNCQSNDPRRGYAIELPVWSL